jgi:DNA-binding transcriptional LysR family regulator
MVGVELRHLAVFAAVAEEGSFTAAARRLKMAQSGVSAAVRALEREFQVTLFDRTTHRVELTRTGQLLLPEAWRTLAAAASARDVINKVHGGLRGTVRLGIMQREPSLSIPRLITEFRSDHPHVDVELHRGSSAMHARDLRKGRLDLAFVALESGTGLTLTELVRQTMQLVCAADHPLADRTSVELSELTGEPFAEAPPDWGIRMASDRAFASAGIERRVVYEVADVAMVLDFVQHGLAVAIVPPSVVDAPFAQIRLVAIKHHAPLFVTSIATPTHRELGAPASALLHTARRLAVG